MELEVYQSPSDGVRIFKHLIGDEEQDCVHLRQIYKWVGLNPDNYTRWLSSNFEDFKEDRDYSILSQELSLLSEGSLSAGEIIISIDTAKHICMLARTDRGKVYRNYLINRDKTLRLLEKDRKFSQLMEVNKILIEDRLHTNALIDRLCKVSQKVEVLEVKREITYKTVHQWLDEHTDERFSNSEMTKIHKAFYAEFPDHLEHAHSVKQNNMSVYDTSWLDSNRDKIFNIIVVLFPSKD